MGCTLRCQDCEAHDICEKNAENRKKSFTNRGQAILQFFCKVQFLVAVHFGTWFNPKANIFLPLSVIMIIQSCECNSSDNSSALYDNYVNTNTSFMHFSIAFIRKPTIKIIQKVYNLLITSEILFCKNKLILHQDWLLSSLFKRFP